MIKKIILMTLLVLLSSVIYLKFLTKPSSEPTLNVTRTAKVSLDIQPNGEVAMDIPTATKRKMIELLRNRKFIELDDLIERYAVKFDNGSITEHELDDLLNSLAVIDPSFEKPLLDWVRETQSWSANLAAARYFDSLAWQWRGNAFLSKVPALNQKNYRRFQGLSSTFMQDAKQNNGRDVLWYADQIALANQGGIENELNLIKEALAKFPQSRVIHHSAIHAQSPNWGGNERYRQQLIHSYSTIMDQAGHDGGPTVYYYRALDAAREHDYVKAISEIRNALVQSPNRLWYYALLARYYYETEQYPLALAAIDISLEHRPDRVDDLLRRANILLALGQTEGAAVDLERILSSSPMHKEANLKLFSAYAKLGKRDAALAALERAGFFKQEDADELVRHGFHAEHDLKDPELAKRYYYQSIALSKYNSGAHYSLSTIYGNEESCKIVDHLHKYLTACKLGEGNADHWCAPRYINWGYSSITYLKGHNQCPEINDYNFDGL